MQCSPLVLHLIAIEQQSCVQVKAAQSTVKMGVDYDNQYQVDIPLTVSGIAHTAVSVRVKGYTPCCKADNLCMVICHVVGCINRPAGLMLSPYMPSNAPSPTSPCLKHKYSHTPQPPILACVLLP